MARTKLDHVLLGNLPGVGSPWSQATGREFDIRTASYGANGYSITVNRDRVADGTTGWICLRDGAFGQMAGLCVFTGNTAAKDADEVAYAPAVIYPLPRDHWLDGARIRLSGWSGRAPFKDGPSRFKNGEALNDDDARVLLRLLAEPVRIWRAAVISEGGARR